MDNNPGAKWIVNVGGGGEFAQGIKYMMMHAIGAYVVMLIGPLCWHSFAFHTIFLVLILSSAVHTGGKYYFRVFAKRYMTNLVKLEQDDIKPAALNDEKIANIHQDTDAGTALVAIEKMPEGKDNV